MTGLVRALGRQPIARVHGQQRTGARVLGRLPQQGFRRVGAVLLIVLGIYMAAGGGT